MKRDHIKKIKKDLVERGEVVDEAEIGGNLPEQDVSRTFKTISESCTDLVFEEQRNIVPRLLLDTILRPFLPQILIQSVCETLVPKLVAEDLPLLQSLLTDVFPGITYKHADVSCVL